MQLFIAGAMSTVRPFRWLHSVLALCVLTVSCRGQVNLRSGFSVAASSATTLAEVAPIKPQDGVDVSGVVSALATGASSGSSDAGAPAGAPKLRPSGLLTVRSLRVAGSTPQGSRVFLGAPEAGISMGTDASGATFSISKDNNGASVTKPIVLLDAQDALHLGATQVEMQSVASAGSLAIRGVKQWELVRQEDFSQTGLGWSRADVTHCGGVNMLGGFCKLSKGEVKKTYAGLPPHKQLRVVATYHFIDRWVGETGYMKLNVGQEGLPVVLWSEQHTQTMSKNGISVCGQAATPEGKFSSGIDVVIEHTSDQLQLTFGSTMEDSDPCDESWGVSGIEIYTRE